MRVNLRGVPKKCHDFNHMPFPQLRTETIVVVVVPNICPFKLTKIQIKHQIFRLSHQRRKSRLPYFSTRTNGSHSLVDSAANVAWNIVIFPGASSFQKNASFFETAGRVPSTHRSANGDRHRH